MPSGFFTDLFGCPQYSDASGRYHSGQREKEKYLARIGFHPAGDKEHGARHEHRLKGTALSGAGVARRTSTGERRVGRATG
jgi:hypothetical protein